MAQNALKSLYSDLTSPDCAIEELANAAAKQARSPPTVVLNKLRPGTNYQPMVIADQGEPDKKEYLVKCVVDDICFEGKGSSVQMAKAQAAKAALHSRFGIKCVDGPGLLPNLFPGPLSSARLLNSQQSPYNSLHV